VLDVQFQVVLFHQVFGLNVNIYLVENNVVDEQRAKVNSPICFVQRLYLIEVLVRKGPVANVLNLVHNVVVLRDVFLVEVASDVPLDFDSLVCALCNDFFFLRSLSVFQRHVFLRLVVVGNESEVGGETGVEGLDSLDHLADLFFFGRDGVLLDDFLVVRALDGLLRIEVVVDLLLDVLRVLVELVDDLVVLYLVQILRLVFLLLVLVVLGNNCRLVHILLVRQTNVSLVEKRSGLRWLDLLDTHHLKDVRRVLLVEGFVLFVSVRVVH
jgi:hypothetical protein